MAMYFASSLDIEITRFVFSCRVHGKSKSPSPSYSGVRSPSPASDKSKKVYVIFQSIFSFMFSNRVPGYFTRQV